MPVYQDKDKNGKPIKNKKGCSWYYRCYYTDIYGKRKQRKSKMYKTGHEALDAEREFLNKVTTTDIVDHNITFEKVYEEWFFYKRRKVKSPTAYSIKKALDKHILNYFKPFKLHSIKSNTINMWYDKISLSGTSIKYQNRLIGYLKECLTYASNNYEYDMKVVANIEKKKLHGIDFNTESEWNYWTYDEFNLFINAVDNDFDSILFNFLYFTGVRIGECLALQWRDINFVRKKIYITKTFNNKLGNGKFELLPPKTKNSYREIDLDDTLYESLKRKYHKDKNMINFDESIFIFGDIKPITPSSVRRHFQIYYNKVIEQNNLKYITIHGFRHSHVSLLINLGCDSRDVAARIGDTVQIVEKTYYHMFPEKKSVTVMALNNLKKSKNKT